MGPKRPCTEAGDGSGHSLPPKRRASVSATAPVAATDSAILAYPFKATRTQVWRRAVLDAGSNPNPNPVTVVRLPSDVSGARERLSSMSSQQNLAASYLINSMISSYAAGGINVFHLGGLPGAGKTTIVKELIALLHDANLINSKTTEILLCSKSNTAKASLMSACETGVRRGELLFNEGSFATLNSGFEIPVIHNRNEITSQRIRMCCINLKRKMIYGLGSLRLLVIDEYTMSSCREIVYIDALLRIINFRPDIPFGGVFVVFLGDNRQNSAVVENNYNNNSSSISSNRRHHLGSAESDSNDKAPLRGEEFDMRNAKMYTEILASILKSFCTKDFFCHQNTMRDLIKQRIATLQAKNRALKIINDDIVSSYEKMVAMVAKKKKMVAEEGGAGRPSLTSEASLTAARTATTTTTTTHPENALLEKSGWTDKGIGGFGFEEGNEQDIDDDDLNDCDYDSIFSDSLLLEALEKNALCVGEKAAAGSSVPTEIFANVGAGAPNGTGRLAERCSAVARANVYFEKLNDLAASVEEPTASRSEFGTDSKIEDGHDCQHENGLEPEPFSRVLEKIPLSVLVEEGLATEIEHLETISRMTEGGLEKYVESMVKEIMAFSNKAMEEIDYTGREKLYVVSGLSERFLDCNVTAMMDEEILVSMYVWRSDHRCSATVPFGSDLYRKRAISSSVRNAFFREGQEFKKQIPVATFFKENIGKLACFLRKPSLTYKDMLNKSREISDLLKTSGDPKNAWPRGTETREAAIEGKSAPNGKGPQAKNETKGGWGEESGDEDADDDDGGDEEDDFDWHDEEGDYADNDEDGYEYERVVSREDAPTELALDSSTSQRVGAMVDFHVCWKRWLDADRPSDLTRCRMWHLYALVRMQQLRYADGNLPSFDMTAFSGRMYFPTFRWLVHTAGSNESAEDLHEEYWLRALSMPLTPGGDASACLLLPAYSSLLSAVSRTYIMSSLKRINPSKHAYALMYGISLLDMTVDLKDLVDTRVTGRGTEPPPGYSSEFDPEKYFDSIFPSVMDEYFLQDKSQIYQDGTSMKETHRAIHHLSSNKNCSDKSVYLAVRMLTSISKGNLRLKLLKEGSSPAVSTGSLAERIARVNSTSEAALDKGRSRIELERMLGAITLTRGHAQKNEVSNLVDLSIINQTLPTGSASATRPSAEGGANAVRAYRSTTNFFVNNINLTHLDYARVISNNNKQQILSLISSTKRSEPLIDPITDLNLLNAANDARKFTKILINLKNKVTKVRAVNLYQGQNVVFTHTNNMSNPIHGETEKFVTKDTGVVTDMFMKNGVLNVSVLVERLGGKTITLKEGCHYLGSRGGIGGAYGIGGYGGTGSRGTFVKYLPLDSSQAMTIYSCQGQTFFRDTVVDLTGASTRDVYVAITRNANPLNLYILKTSQTDRENLLRMKGSMGRDKAGLMPLGGTGNLGGGAFVNNNDVRITKEVLSSLLALSESEMTGEDKMYAALDPRDGTVSLAQEFVMDRSGNALAFNSLWMKNTATRLAEAGLESEMDRMRERFFGRGERECAEYYERKSHEKLVELYTAVVRSVTHYCITSGLVKTPSAKLLEEYETKHKSKNGYVKIHPCFLNRPPKEATVASFLYDVAPHSHSLAVMQFYAHYLFLVYEQIHICNSSFAFLPSPMPLMNEYVRPIFSDDTTGAPERRQLEIPSLAYESRNFKRAADCGNRDPDLRRPLTPIDELGDKISKLRDFRTREKFDENKADECTEICRRLMANNLRRAGKFCRPSEVHGLSKHGAVVISSTVESHENVHFDPGRGWLSLSYEANLYGLLVFMTKMAAASGITPMIINDAKALEPSPGSARLLATSEEITPSDHIDARLSSDFLYCGQVDPMRRVQFSLHLKRRSPRQKGAIFSGPRKIFGPEFQSKIFGRLLVESAKVVGITQMLGHQFPGHSTADIRNGLLHSAGKVKCVRDIQLGNSLAGLEKCLIDSASSILNSGTGDRVSFFISCEITSAGTSTA